MSSINEHINKVRQERIAREKARIQKLRELNLKKYNKEDSLNVIPKKCTKNVVLKQPRNFHGMNGTCTASGTKSASTSISNKCSSTNGVKNIAESKVSNNAKAELKATSSATKSTTERNNVSVTKSISTVTTNIKILVKPTSDGNSTLKNEHIRKVGTSAHVGNSTKKLLPSTSKPVQCNTNLRKSFVPKILSRKSTAPTQSASRESVFDRLYKPKIAPKKAISDIERLQTDPKFLKATICNTGLILNKRCTVFEQRQAPQMPRRSISAVHFKRISANELTNCIHKYSSVGEKLDKVHLEEINEDDFVDGEKIISAVKCERKKVKFLTPVPSNFNTPKPGELQERLKNWLQKRGKSFDSFHHLQCFGIHHLPKEQMTPLEIKYADEENKENVPLDHDSDSDSYNELFGNNHDQKWRRVSSVSDSVDFNDTKETIDSLENPQVNEVLLGALNDLTELLKEGYEWEQCARWLRAVRERFPTAVKTSAYWECRAALEERRGDLPAAVECWEEAIAMGTQHSVVEANLDQLLDKFIQLKISPNGGKKQPDPKMVDVKNVFKSTVIRFAVQQAKLRQSNSHTPATFTATPVRRSTRLSAHCTAKRTPLQVCDSLKHVGIPRESLVFVPNQHLVQTP